LINNPAHIIGQILHLEPKNQAIPYLQVIWEKILFIIKKSMDEKTCTITEKQSMYFLFLSLSFLASSSQSSLHSLRVFLTYLDAPNAIQAINRPEAPLIVLCFLINIQL